MTAPAPAEGPITASEPVTLTSPYREIVQYWISLGAHLLPLRRGEKAPVNYGWQKAPPMTTDDAVAWLECGGNLGVNLPLSGWIMLDGEDALATQALVEAGFTPLQFTAKSRLEPGRELNRELKRENTKIGGSHVLLVAPEGVDVAELRGDQTGLTLPNGGKIDVLMGNRYAVIAPSRLDEAWGEAYELAADAVPFEAPSWLFDGVGTPPSLATIGGAATPKPAYERVEQDARSQELSDLIDAVPWSEWLAGETRLQTTGQLDTCGCEIWHWHSSDNPKSVTLHDGCSKGCGAHVWSGTMIGELQLGSDHLSRLSLAASLRGVTVQAAAASVGIQLGGSGEELAPVRPEHFEAHADEIERTLWVSRVSSSGVVERVQVDDAEAAAAASRNREAAGEMRRTLKLVASDGEEVGERSRIGGGVPVPPQRPGTSPPTPGTTVAVRSGLPAVDPLLSRYIARAEDELREPPTQIDPGALLSRGLLPHDLRSLREAVYGPRATYAPVDVEATDGQLAQAVAAAVGGRKLIHAADAQTWYGWDGNRFEIDSTAAQLAVQALLQRHQQSSDPGKRQRKIRVWAWKKLNVEQKAKIVARDPNYTIDQYGDLIGPNGETIERVAVEIPEKGEATATRNAVVAQLGAAAEVVVRTAALDADPGVVGVRGGYLHLADPKTAAAESPAVMVTSPDPSRRVTKLMGAAYDPSAECPLWEQALADALPDSEVRHWLQKTTGQALFGRQDEHLLLVLEGYGGNGKGLVVDVLTAVFGDYSATLQTSVLTLAGMNNHATDLMPLKGARFATADEVPPQQLSIDRLKKITGGGTFPARLCGQDQTEWEQSHLLCLTTNNKLQWAPSAMAAVRRRLAVIRFDVEFGAPGAPAMVGGLADRIAAEEGSGVLNWLVEGYRLFTLEGLETYQDLPPTILEWTQATLAQSSSWAAFCDLAFEPTKNPGDVLLSAEIFPVWDFFRSEDTDQKHASPGSTRVVAAMVAEQVRGVTRIEAKGKTKAGVSGIKWSKDGLELLAEMERDRNPLPGITGPGPAPWMAPPAAASA